MKITLMILIVKTLVPAHIAIRRQEKDKSPFCLGEGKFRETEQEENISWSQPHQIAC